MTTDLSVIVVNYNSGAYLERCVGSLKTHLAGRTWDGVVIDNASTDGSEAAAERGGLSVTLVRNPENVGFGQAVNQGVRLTTGPLILLLNPDACLLPDAVDRMCAEIVAHPDCAIVGPMVVDDDGRPQGSARGDPNMLTGLFGRSTWLSRHFPNFALTRRNVVAHATTDATPGVEVDWVSGSCMLLRRDAFVGIGGFDPGYFMYWEDADLCRRLRSDGWRVRYRPDASVAHAVGQSSRTAQRLAVRAFHDSAYRYYSTHETPGRWNPLRGLAWVLLRVRCVWLLTTRRADSRPRG